MNFIIKILELLFSFIEAGLKFLFEAIEFGIANIPKRKQGYNASFAPVSSLLSSSHKGFCLTGNKNLSVKNSYQNALIIGGTGVGKSSIVLIPSLYSMQGSFIVNDPSGELYSKSAGYLFQRGYEVKILHFANPVVSSAYNPLQRANSSSEIQKVAGLLVHNSIGKNEKDAFWHTLATSLLTMLIAILKTQNPKFQNLYNVRCLLNNLGAYPDKVDRLFVDFANENLYTEYKSFFNYDEKVVSGVISSAKAALQIFSDEHVAKITCCDNIDFTNFRRKKTALFIQNSVADQRYYSGLTSIFFEQFFSFVLSKFPEIQEQDIFFLIDECSSLKLPTLQMAVANVRKHRAGIMLVVQDFNQLVNSYGWNQAEAIRSNCFAQLFFTAQGLSTAKELSEILGKYEYREKEKTSSGHTEKKVIRSLMTPDEIRTMSKSKALLICGHHPPMQVKLKAYYENSRFRHNDRIAPPAPSGEFAFETLPALDLNFIDTEE